LVDWRDRRDLSIFQIGLPEIFGFIRNYMVGSEYARLAACVHPVEQNNCHVFWIKEFLK